MKTKRLLCFSAALMLCLLPVCGVAAAEASPEMIVSPAVQKDIDELILLINELRIENGVHPLSTDYEGLRIGAQVRAEELPALFSHTRPDGRPCTSIFEDYGVERDSGFVENVGGGPATPAGMLATWLESSQHRSNILSRDMNYIGVGYIYAEGTKYTHHWLLLMVGLSHQFEVVPVEVAVGQSLQMEYTADPPNHILQPAWESDNPAVASITPDGLLTAHTPGTAQITASISTSFSTSATATVTVLAGTSEEGSALQANP